MYHPLIVVVDDNTDYLSFMTTLLAFAGYSVLICRRSDEAVPLVRARHPDFVLLDIRMEDADSGFTILAALRADPITAAIPILLCSADVEALDAFAAQNREPHTATIVKPFELSDLLHTLSRLDQSDSVAEVMRNS